MSLCGLIAPDSTRIFIDHQPPVAFGIANKDRQRVKKNTVALAKAGKLSNVPVIDTSAATKSVSGSVWPPLLTAHFAISPLEYSPMN